MVSFCPEEPPVAVKRRFIFSGQTEGETASEKRVRVAANAPDLTGEIAVVALDSAPSMLIGHSAEEIAVVALNSVPLNADWSQRPPTNPHVTPLLPVGSFKISGEENFM